MYNTNSCYTNTYKFKSDYALLEKVCLTNYSLKCKCKNWITTKISKKKT